MFGINIVFQSMIQLQLIKESIIGSNKCTSITDHVKCLLHIQFAFSHHVSCNNSRTARYTCFTMNKYSLLCCSCFINKLERLVEILNQVLFFNIKYRYNLLAYKYIGRQDLPWSVTVYLVGDWVVNRFKVPQRHHMSNLTLLKVL